MLAPGMGDLLDVVTFKPVRDLAGGIVDNIPGLNDLVNGPLRDFANTAVGHTVLIAISGNFYGGLVPWVGPQLASVAFAVPGLMTGDDFFTAWLAGVKERTERTAQILGIDAAQIFSTQLSDVLQKMYSDFGVENTIQDSIQSLVDRYGIRQDVATFAKSLWNKIEIPPPCIDGACSGDMFDLATGNLRTGIDRMTGAGISLATLASEATVGTWEADNATAPRSMLATEAVSGSWSADNPANASHLGFSQYRSTSYGSAATSPNRASGDVLLAVSLAGAAAALWFFFRR
jgi:hypothetical protein